MRLFGNGSSNGSGKVQSLTHFGISNPLFFEDFTLHGSCGGNKTLGARDGTSPGHQNPIILLLYFRLGLKTAPLFLNLAQSRTQPMILVFRLCYNK